MTTAAAPAEALRNVPLPRPTGAVAQPAPVPVATVTTVAAIPAQAAAPAPAAPDPGAQVRQIVVPVKLPPGARYEIVIKLQLDTTA